MESLAAAAQFSKLPEDIIHNILYRLQAKPLLRMKCINKSLYSLISDPQFAQMYLKLASQYNPPRILLLHYMLPYKRKNINCQPSVLSPDFKRVEEKLTIGCGAKPDAYMIMGYCHGLICLTLHPEYHRLRNDLHPTSPSRIFLWNPSISLFKELPRPTLCSDSCILWGLGYDSSVDDYKLLIATSNYFRIPSRIPDLLPNSPRLTTEFQVELFTAKTNCWRSLGAMDINGDISCFSREDERHATYLNGSLHWMVFKKTHIRTQRFFFVLAFNLADCKFSQMPCPQEHLCTLGILGDFLCLCMFDSVYTNSVWILKEYYNNNVRPSWTKLFTIMWSETGLAGDLGRSPFIATPLCFSNKDDEVLVSFADVKLMTCNLKDNTFKTVFEVEGCVKPSHVRYVEILAFSPALYVQSLALSDIGGANLAEA